METFSSIFLYIVFGAAIGILFLAGLLRSILGNRGQVINSGFDPFGSPQPSYHSDRNGGSFLLIILLLGGGILLFRYHGTSSSNNFNERLLHASWSPPPESSGIVMQHSLPRSNYANSQALAETEPEQTDQMAIASDEVWVEEPIAAESELYFYIQHQAVSAYLRAIEAGNQLSNRFSGLVSVGVTDEQFSTAYKILLGPFTSSAEAKAFQRQWKIEGFVRDDKDLQRVDRLE